METLNKKIKIAKLSRFKCLKYYEAKYKPTHTHTHTHSFTNKYSDVAVERLCDIGYDGLLIMTTPSKNWAIIYEWLIIQETNNFIWFQFQIECEEEN
jgi:hypothetical protein